MLLGRTSPPGPTGHGSRLRGWGPLLAALSPALFAALVAFVPANDAGATTVTGLQARHHDGQTFLTWLTPSGTGWTYRVYRSTNRITRTSDLSYAVLLGSVGDSTWCDRRLSSLTGQVYGYRTDSTAKPLTFVRGLFVATTEVSGSVYYAVTCQAAGGAEDKTISLGANSLSGSQAELLGLPRPVYQRNISKDLLDVEVYTLWTHNRSTASFPKMSNRSGTPYDLSVVRGTTGDDHALMFRPHVRGGNFLQVCLCPTPSEYMLQLDDFTYTPDVNTFWFGYSESYNINSGANVPPGTGYVCDYTMERVVWTIRWALRNFPVDPTRVYASGSSMGGICAVALALYHPELVAAVLASVPRFDFSEESDPNVPASQFNAGEGQRQTCDRLWGTVNTDLRLDDGTPVYDRLNGGAMARRLEPQFVPPIIAFNGRNDHVVGWAEKIPFYQAMRESHAGGTFYWDMREHSGGAAAGWLPMQDDTYLYRFKTNRSFPALSNCSADGNPGNGLAADGDSLGTINGFVEWDTSLVDQPNSWQVRLNSRDLTTRWGILPSPDSLTVDVTLRRLQSFAPLPGVDYQWSVVRRSTWTVIQSGLARLDAKGVMTIPGVKVYPSGSILSVGDGSYGISGVGPRLEDEGLHPVIAPFENPTRAALAITVTWPRDGEARIDLLDLAGRQVRRVDAARVQPGPRTVHFDASGLRSGVYFVRARQDGAPAVRRVTLIH